MSDKRRLSLLVLAPVILLALLVAGCGAISSPQGWASPVVTSAGFLTSLHKGKLALLDLNDRHTVWEFPNSANSADKAIKLQGIYGTPAVASDTVVFAGYNGHVYALGLADGVRKWDYDTGATVVGGVALDNARAYVGNSDGDLLALDISADAGTKPKDRLKWHVKAQERIWSAPTVQNGVVYVTAMDRHVYAFAADTGAAIWNRKSAAGAITSRPVLSNGKVYFGSFDRYLYALDDTSGVQSWRSATAAQNWLWTTPLVVNGTVYTGSVDGTVYAVDSQSGAVHWSKKMSGAIRGQPALAQGVLIVADRSGDVRGFDPASGDQKWQKQLDSTSLGDLVINNDAVLIVTEGGKGGSQFVQIDPVTGDVTVLARA